MGSFLTKRFDVTMIRESLIIHNIIALGIFLVAWNIKLRLISLGVHQKIV